MNRGFLSAFFEGVAVKRLSKVDADRKSSNQREVGDSNDGQSLKPILGNEPRTKPNNNRFNTTYIWLNAEQESITEYGLLSWYDTRRKRKSRDPEWRAYYQRNAVTEIMSEGDTLFLALKKDGSLLFIVVPDGNEQISRMHWLFGLEEQQSLDFLHREYNRSEKGEIDFIARFLLDEIGIEYEDPNANTLDSIIARYKLKFPTTREFSALARNTLPEVDAVGYPDLALISWLNHEEAMFRRMEKKIVSRRIQEGFIFDGEADVDAFIKFSLSVQNRRKSRMGYSLENHLSALFDIHEISFSAQVKTEKGKKPDYIFPNSDNYFDPSFDTKRLTMLAAKSSCKDRWSQVLPEAERIKQKHLLTLEPAIAEPTTDTMRASSLQLIVPKEIQRTYKKTQQEWLWNVEDFLNMVKERQRQARV